MRDLEHLILNTISIQISSVTGIPTGRIYAKIPDFEYVNKYDGTNTPQYNQEKFPAIGMKYSGKVIHKPNMYGEQPIVIKTPEVYKIYNPIGELHIPLSIYLYTNSRKEQRTIGNELAFHLDESDAFDIINDEIPDQYFSVEYHGFEDASEHRPYLRVLYTTLLGQVYREVTGYVVEEINTSIGTFFRGQIVNGDTITNTITGDTYVNENVSITASMTEEGFSFVTEDGTILAFEIEE